MLSENILFTICIRGLLLFFLLTIVLANSTDEDRKYFTFKLPNDCIKSEIFDFDYFSCVECNISNSLVPSNDRTYCSCSPKTETNILFDSLKQGPICRTLNCVNCVDLPKVKCKHKFILDTFRNDSNQKSIQVTNAVGNCACDEKVNTIYHEYCIANNLLKRLQYFSYFDQRKIFKELKFVVFFCRVLKQSTACNHLANLCVASHYNLEKNSPCSLFYLAQATEAAEYSSEELKDIRPFLFYRKGKKTVQDLERVIDYQYNLSGHGKEGGRLELFGITYFLDGTVQRLDSVNPQHLSLCNQFVLPKIRYIRFAQNINVECQLSLNNIIDLAKIYADKQFLSVFLNFTIDNVKYIYPVPVLVENAMSNTQNTKSDEWQLVKRFQMISAHPKPYGDYFGSSYSDSSKLGLFKSIRFVDYIDIQSTIREDNKISPPIIRINYKEINVYSNSSLSELHTVVFRVDFLKDYNMNFWFQVLLPLLLMIAFVFSIFKTRVYKIRHNKEFYDFSAFLHFTFNLFSQSGTVFFCIAIGTCLWKVLVYTSSKNAKIVLPIIEDDLVEVLIFMAALLKAVYILYWFRKIVQMNIFFIDWERPRGFDIPLSTRIHADTPSVCSGGSVKSWHNDGVSAWRMFFVANEWIELSLKRRTSLLWQSVLFLLIMQTIVETWPDELNDPTIKLTAVAVAYVAVHLLQIFFRFIFWSRTTSDPLQRFVNLCSMANISVFILLEGCHGFYIHGRSPHGFADTDMSSMLLQLQRDEGQTASSKRGLLAGSDQQVFVILAPGDLRSYYKKLITPLIKSGNMSQIHFEKEMVNGRSGDGVLEKTTAAYNSANRFFCAFIDHAIKDLDYIITNKNIIETFLDCEFNCYLTGSKGTFYIENKQSFENVMLFGSETEIFLLQLYILLSMFILSKSTYISILICSVIISILKLIFKYKMKINLSRKTLIDKQFLI